jgi:hypothetical protein
LAGFTDKAGFTGEICEVKRCEAGDHMIVMEKLEIFNVEMIKLEMHIVRAGRYKGRRGAGIVFHKIAGTLLLTFNKYGGYRTRVSNENFALTEYGVKALGGKSRNRKEIFFDRYHEVCQGRSHSCSFRRLF